MTHKDLAKFTIVNNEGLLIYLALFGMGYSMRMTLGMFIHAKTELTAAVFAGAVFYAVGLAAAARWSVLTQFKDGWAYRLVKILAGVLVVVGMFTYSWFALNGVA